MTEQLTIKLNKQKFKPILEIVKGFLGEGLYTSDSDLVGKGLFFCAWYVRKKHPELKNKTLFEFTRHITEDKGHAERVLTFLSEYSRFQKEGLQKDWRY